MENAIGDMKPNQISDANRTYPATMRGKLFMR